MTSIDLHPPIVETTLWADEAATARAASALAAAPAIAQAFIALEGELGAGKTTFVRHLLRALGVSGRIKSPTYAVVEPHEVAATTGRAPLSIWHFDFYRFSDPREWEDAGFRDLFAAPGLKLAEWTERVGAYLPTPDLVIALAPNAAAGSLPPEGDDEDEAPQARDITLTARTPIGRELLGALHA